MMGKDDTSPRKDMGNYREKHWTLLENSIGKTTIGKLYGQILDKSWEHQEKPLKIQGGLVRWEDHQFWIYPSEPCSIGAGSAGCVHIFFGLV